MDLAGKLQLGDRALAVVNPPAGFTWDGPMAKEPRKAEAVLVFVKDSQELKARAKPAIEAARRDAIAYVAYPKAGQLGTDLDRDSLWAMLEGQGIRPVRQIAIDDTWSALRFRPAE